MVGRIYAWLYLNPNPVALEDIASSLSVSKASASIVVRQLAQMHAVRQVWTPGDRRDFYEAETDFSSILREGLLPGIRKKLNTAGVQIERSLATTSSASSKTEVGTEPSMNREQAAEIRRRLKSAQSLHKRIDRILASKLLSRLL
jgi:DNA-binding transcriptional regulator GbsR (MarR family)